jgi:hypothetical protein
LYRMMLLAPTRLILGSSCHPRIWHAIWRPFTLSCQPWAALPPRPKPPPDSEIEESYLKGSGPGGQKIVRQSPSYPSTENAGASANTIPLRTRPTQPSSLSIYQPVLWLSPRRRGRRVRIARLLVTCWPRDWMIFETGIKAGRRLWAR